MEPISALIVDDEPWARELIATLLKDEDDIIIAGQCGDGVEALAAMRSLSPDLVFLDVQMPGMDGFAAIEQIPAESLPAIIFVTAYDEHALRAFEANAVGYLLKPIDAERFAQTLRRAVEIIESGRTAEYARRLEMLLAGRKKPFLERILVKTRDGQRLLRVAEIDWIEAAGNYVSVHVGAQSHLVRQTMKSIESSLDPASFLRIHRSIIVNLDRVESLHPAAGGEYAVKLRDGTELTLSRGYRHRLEQFLPASS